jgi:hypothetical protein
MVLFEQDEIKHREELLRKEGSNETRIEGMRQRMNYLRENRERDRKATVKEKLDHQWRFY